MADGRRQRRGGALGAAGLVSGLTLISRVLGLIRDAVTTHALGRSAALDVFVVAWMLPNLLRRLFGEGALSAALVPELTARRTHHGDAAARNLLGGVLGALILAIGSLVLVGVVLALALPAGAFTSMGADPSQGELFAELFARLFPYALPVCLMATLSGALNVLGRFAPGALAPALLNVFWIGGLLLGLAQSPDDPAAITRSVAVALLLGGLAQLLVVALPLWRLRMLARPHLPNHADGSRAVFRRMLPTVVGMSALQLNVLVDQSVAYWLVGAGANSSLFLANRLLLFPHALIALPIATVAFPRLASHATTGDFATLRDNLRQALRLTTYFAVPAALGMALVAEELIAVAFQHGAFDARDTVVTAWTTIALVISLPMVGAAQLLARVYYALGEARRPAQIALRLVFVNALLNLALARGLGMGAPGLALATTLTAGLNLILLWRRLDAQARPTEGLRAPTLHCLLAALAMAALVTISLRLGTAWAGDEPGRLLRAAVGLVLPIGVGMVGYLAAHRLLGGAETHAALAAVRGRRITRRG